MKNDLWGKDDKNGRLNVRRHTPDRSTARLIVPRLLFHGYMPIANLANSGVHSSAFRLIVTLCEQGTIRTSE